ncbi:MAG: HutD family protein [Sphingopyxis sp.]|uniref:HutD/Ves family protein n=1 Tax=Sphingopyxis sp. TaxID=1908224 RepID=UPI002ABB55EF|nr:HutD family protein [Sphingopyxis sp.]MDZ3833528.1 HutD family protein [Sphingopyxis sp.]
MRRPPILLPASTRTPRPWRNGGGVTHDLRLYPEGAGDDDFLWRASIASITAPGPFSAWPGIDRTLAPLTGTLALSIDGATAMLHPGDPPQAFAGEAVASGHPVGGACTALNIMARRGRARAEISRDRTIIPGTAAQILLLADQAAMLRMEDDDIPLDTGDALVLESPRSAIESDRPLLIVRLFDTP